MLPVVRRRARQQGAALLLVTWTVALLSLLAAAALQISTASANTFRSAAERARAGSAADEAIVLALVDLTQNPRQGSWGADGYSQAQDVDGYHFTVVIRDEAGRMDVNAAPPSMLEQLFLGLGATTREASDWRRTIEKRRGINPDSIAASPFRDLDEFRLQAGIADEQFSCMRPYLTAYSGMPGIDARFAGEPVRRAAGLEQPTSMDTAATPAGHALEVQVRLAGTAEQSGSTAIKLAVVRLTGDPDRPLLVTAWDSPVADKPAECPSR